MVHLVEKNIKNIQQDRDKRSGGREAPAKQGARCRRSCGIMFDKDGSEVEG